jgi:acyl-CoA thioesterase-2
VLVFIVLMHDKDHDWHTRCMDHAQRTPFDLAQLGNDVYRAEKDSSVAPRSFGGQLAAQALSAAGCTVASERGVHSLYGQFLRFGDPQVSTTFVVERTHDGGSFSARRVVAEQGGKPIFHLVASFHSSEAGLEHQVTMPPAPEPDDLPTLGEQLAQHAHALRDSAVVRWMREVDNWVDLRYVDAPPFGAVGRLARPRSQVWFRVRGELTGDPCRHACFATYMSDLTILDPVLLAHGRGGWVTRDVVGASVNHAMWFHRPFRADEWLLYDQESPSASGGRVCGQVRIFARDRSLVMSVLQEAVLRVPR